MELDIRIERIGPNDNIEAYCRMMARAFEGYPVPENAFRSSPGKVSDWAEGMMDLAITNRLEMNVPCFAAYLGEELAGVAILSDKDIETPPQCKKRIDDFMERAGTAASAFLHRFFDAVDSVNLTGKHVYLAILGVEPIHQGKGVGRSLIEAIAEYASRIDGVTGVALDTEDTRNVDIYKACGFYIVGQRAVDEMPVFVMWRDVPQKP